MKKSEINKIVNSIAAQLLNDLSCNTKWQNNVIDQFGIVDGNRIVNGINDLSIKLDKKGIKNFMLDNPEIDPSKI